MLFQNVNKSICLAGLIYCGHQKWVRASIASAKLKLEPDGKYGKGDAFVQNRQLMHSVCTVGWALWNRNSFEFKFDDTRLSS